KGGRGGIGTPMDTLHTGQMGLRRPMTCIVRDAMDGGGPCMDFIASDEATDRYGEAIDQNGWQLEHFRRNPVIADSHDYSSVSRILGRAVRVEVREGRLHNRVEFCTANPLGNLAYRMARGGFIRSQSVGFIPLEWEEGLGQDEPKRTYTRAELLEISLVAIPANPGATIGMALKNGAVTRRDLGELYEFLSRSGVASAPTGSIFPAEQQPSDERWYGLARQLKPLIERP
ncbi:MAG: HK97 family phage prohead protease, partial [Verrucomicrobia bacterium]|nr:HK97 family phage prohead protease [Verrucomicrobiota bacterium]